MNDIRVYVVDDEQPARRKLLRFLADEEDIVIAGEASNGTDAVRGIRETAPDLVFLDIQMAGMGGFDVIRALQDRELPRIVFVTAYDEYAIQAFDVHAFGYLLKPFDRARLTRVLDHYRNEPNRATERHLLIDENERALLVPYDSIDWACAERNYIRLHVGDRVHSIRGTIDALTEKLDPARFLRLNRSNLVRIEFIREMQKWFHGEYKVVLRNGVSLTWTRRYVQRQRLS